MCDRDRVIVGKRVREVDVCGFFGCHWSLVVMMIAVMVGVLVFRVGIDVGGGGMIQERRWAWIAEPEPEQRGNEGGKRRRKTGSRRSRLTSMATR